MGEPTRLRVLAGLLPGVLALAAVLGTAPPAASAPFDCVRPADHTLAQARALGEVDPACSDAAVVPGRSASSAGFTSSPASTTTSAATPSPHTPTTPPATRTADEQPAAGVSPSAALETTTPTPTTPPATTPTPTTPSSAAAPPRGGGLVASAAGTGSTASPTLSPASSAPASSSSPSVVAAPTEGAITADGSATTPTVTAIVPSAPAAPAVDGSATLPVVPSTAGPASLGLPAGSTAPDPAVGQGAPGGSPIGASPDSSPSPSVEAGGGGLLTDRGAAVGDLLLTPPVDGSVGAVDTSPVRELRPVSTPLPGSRVEGLPRPEGRPGTPLTVGLISLAVLAAVAVRHRLLGRGR